MVYNTTGDAMKIMTFNLKNDTVFTRKSMRWQNRKTLIQQLLRTYQPDIIGVQELTPLAKLEMQDLLPEYCFVGQPRNKHWKIMNEQTDIGYLRQRFECLEEQTLWLSARPEQKGSRVWTSVFPRICTKACFYDSSSGQRFLVYNTHLDHLLPYSRAQELVILDKLLKQPLTHELPLILMGDFNTTLSSKALKTFLYRQNTLRCVYSSMQAPLHNTIHTGNGQRKLKKQPIDYIFVSQQLSIESCEIITAQFQGSYPSDHYPVICQLEWKKSPFYE